MVLKTKAPTASSITRAPAIARVFFFDDEVAACCAETTVIVGRVTDAVTGAASVGDWGVVEATSFVRASRLRLIVSLPGDSFVSAATIVDESTGEVGSSVALELSTGDSSGATAGVSSVITGAASVSLEG